MTDTILPDKQLSNSAYSHVISVPIDKVDIAKWLFNSPEAEYQRCYPPDHISCGTTSTDDGTRMSINVEMIGATLMIQHYVAEVATAALCRMVSISDAFTPNGRTRVQVIWTLSLKRIDDRSCEYTNSVVADPTVHGIHRQAQHKFLRRQLPRDSETEAITIAERRHSFAASIERQALHHASRKPPSCLKQAIWHKTRTTGEF